MRIKISFISIIYALPVFAINPEKEYITSPEYYQITHYDTITVNTIDDYNLFLYDIPAIKTNKKVYIIITYGDAGNLSYYFGYAKALNERGFSVILYDYRGFGKSSNFSTNKNMLFYNEYSTDLATVVDYCRRKNDSYSVGILAFSMGTVITTLALNSTPVDFIIAENYASDITGTLQKLNKERIDKLTLPASFSIDEYEECLRTIIPPLLLFNANRDKAIGINDYKIFLKKENFHLVSYDNEHGHGYNTLNDCYFDAISNFVGKYVDN